MSAESLDQDGAYMELAQSHLERALLGLRPTTVDWLRAARNFVEFANRGGRFDEVREYLERREIRLALKQRSS